MNLERVITTVRIGVTAQHLLSGNHYWSAFQTSSAPNRAKRAGENDKTRSIATAAHFGPRTTTMALPRSATTPHSAATLVRERTTRSVSCTPEKKDFRDGKPTLAYAKTMPKTFASMTNDQILHFAELGIPEACRECIVRDIMAVDQVEYDEVGQTLCYS